MLTGRIVGWAARVPGGVDGFGDALRAQRRVGDRVADPARPAEIPAGRWRRMSRLSRLAALAVRELSLAEPDLDWASMPVVHGTAMGEVVPSSAFLDRILVEGPLRGSPTSFQNSVYNATEAHLSLVFGLRGPAETVSAGMATGLMALSRALEWTATASHVLLVVGDDLNPTTERAFAGRPGGESVVAALVAAGEGIRVADGVVPGFEVARGVALPYEERFRAREGLRPEAVVGLCCANGLLALLTGFSVLDQDDGLALTGFPGSG